MSKELIEKYVQRENEILGKIKTICTTVVDNNRTFSETEHADVKKYKEEARQLRQVRIDLEEMFANEAATRSTTNPVDAPTPAEQFEAQARGLQANDASKQERIFKNLGEQLRAIKRASAPGAVADPRLDQVRQREMERRAASGLSENIDADGGFLLEPAIADELLKMARESSVLYNLVSRRRLTIGNSLKMKGLSDDSRVKGSLAGGIVIYPAAEADDYVASKIKFREVSFELKKIIAACYVTDEEIEDIPLLTDRIMEEFTEAFGVEVDGYLFEGDGLTVSQGLIKTPCKVTVDIESGQTLAANPIVPQNVVKMRSRGLIGSRPNAVWLANPDIEPYLHLMALEVGVGGGPVFMPMGGLSADPYDKLTGRPIIPFEHCNAVGTPGDLVYTDPSKYVLIDKNGLKAQVSIHVRFLQDEQCFKFTYRFDGKIPYDKPLTPRKGGITKSPVVLLGART